ncbi:hypothetical protein Syn7502_00653 [Synechococcus sp. PCC 7502]|uniref:hypothetical protein n=1 Tax=Synechococcus sp. PCC 7502 TaxID=1173263 RepID=UPI00029F926A|nr:hypothetical protein [Synechococcus sp. PCC 7502]AFY72801.1 hypothetical protein Syn7502_00653 [Synechococcus sp. PCC 7502]
MLDFSFLFEFSRCHCLSICAFLVPANAIATLQTLIFVGRRSPRLSPIILASVIYALTMILHVFTWFVVGVVMAPTFILLSLGIVCLAINIWAIADPETMGNLLRQLWQFGVDKVTAKFGSRLITEWHG